MNIFRKRETLKDTIPLMALFIALELILISLIAYFPFLVLFLFFILAFPSFILGCLIKYRYYLIYSLILLGLSLLTCFNNISIPIIYLFPSLVVGFLFSISIKNKIDQYLILLITSIVYCLIEFIIFRVYKFLFNIDVIEYFINLFKLDSFIYYEYIVYFVVYFYSFISTFLSFLFIKFNINKIDKSLNFVSYKNLDIYLSLVSLFIFLVIIVTTFFELSRPFSLVLALINLNNLIYLIYKDIKKDNYISIVILCSLFLISFILIAFIHLNFIILTISGVLSLEFVYFLVKKYFINKNNNLK